LVVGSLEACSVFVIRRSKVEDVSTLLKLAKMVHFINLPPDKDLITEKILRSRASFIRAASADAAGVPAAPPLPPRGGLSAITAASDIFMFTLEDSTTGAVLGTSQVVSRMGGPGAPNVSFRVSRQEFFSEDLQSGTVQTLATLELDESGPTEIGGLILQPSYRHHPEKLGRLLGLIRFHFMGLHRGLFRDRVLAEMMAPITADGRNTLWEYLGRRFINLSYDEADRFCQHSKEFMISLLPREPIYLSLLPPVARAVVGQVGPETVPARKMLEKLGFAYKDCIDPFDGGPHLEAQTDDIWLVQQTRRAVVGGTFAGEAGVGGAGAAEDERRPKAFVSMLHVDGEFHAVQTRVEVGGSDASPTVSLSDSVMEALGVRPGVSVGVTLLDGWPGGGGVEKAEGAGVGV